MSEFSSYQPSYSYALELSNPQTKEVLERIDLLLQRVEEDGDVADLFNDANFESTDLPAEQNTEADNYPRSTKDLRSKFQKIVNNISKLRESHLVPGHKLVSGELVTEHEYYQFRSGITGLVPPGSFPGLMKILGRDWYDEYEIYTHLYYDADDQAGYIYPNCYMTYMRTHDVGTPFLVRPIKPDEVRKSQLSMTQLEFWRLEYPAEFEEFQDA